MMIIDSVFKVLDETYSRYKHFVLAYSGGKDSTAVAILVYRWIRDRGVRDLHVTVLHNDTLSEIDTMEAWARYFMNQLTERLLGLGVKVDVVIASPPPTETFYWRVFVRGYPAPTFSFRWCVHLLKVQPTIKVMSKLRNAILVTGLRDEESGARAKSMKLRFGSCQPGSCLGAYFASNNDMPKVAPIRFWSTEEVWAFLKAQRDFDVEPLFRLYLFNGVLSGRYGCWHCTLVKTQPGLLMDTWHEYLEALRIIYRVVSDTPSLRMPKNTGYSKLGPLNEVGRSIIHNGIMVIEEKVSSTPFYGLDEARIDGHTLREIFYELPPDKADSVIRKYDDSGRAVPTEALRNAARQKKTKQIINTLIDELERKKEPENIKEKTIEILNNID